MTVASALSPISLTQFFYDSGKIVRPARLYFYQPGTTNQVIVYTNPDLSVPHEQPVLSGGSGRVPPIYVGVEPYKVVIYDSRGSQIEEIDYLPGAVDLNPGEPGSALTPAEQQSLLKTGDFVWSFYNAATARVGFVRANGGLIGATMCPHSPGNQVERFNDDVHALFVWLWAQDQNNVSQIIPSRGATAEDDWNNLKALHLPDLCGRSLRGIDGMGGPNKDRLPLTLFGFGPQTVPGAWGGFSYWQLTVAEMPTHSHGLAAAVTGIWTGGAATGITLGAANANISAAVTGIYINWSATNISVNAAYSGISLYGAPTNISVTDAGHGHSLPANLSPDGDGAFHNSLFTGAFRGFTNTGYANINVSDPWHTHSVSDPTHGHGLTDPWHGHVVSDPTHNHAQSPHAHGLSDPWHVHAIGDPAHTHTMAVAGSSQYHPTTGPFLTATCFIKM